MRMDNRLGIKSKDIIKYICYISLFFTVTNLVSLSIGFVSLIVLLPIMGFHKFHITSLHTALFTVYVYFLVSTMLYNPSALFTYAFYRRDGNFFVTFLPIFLIASLCIDFNLEKILNSFFGFVTIIDILCMLLTRINVNPFGILHFETGINHFLFVAHNAAGGFLGVIVALLFGFCIGETDKHQKKYYIFCLVINILALWDSSSRGSILGIVVGMFFLFIVKIKIRAKRYSIGVDGILLLLGILFNVVFVYLYTNNANISAIVSGLINRVGRSYNILLRIYGSWPRALTLFQASPIVGCGFGSFNDVPYQLKEISMGFLAWNYPAEYIYNDAHAHNTYLHLLAETGIVGLMFFLRMLNNVKMKILDIKNKSLSYGLYLALVVSVVSAFTEHRLVTPSQMLPLLLIFSMYISSDNYKKSMSESGVQI